MKNIIIKNLSIFIVALLLVLMEASTITAQAKQLSRAVAAKTIVIDPSGQEDNSLKKEPVGPGSFKYSVQEDTNTELNLQVALKLQDILSNQGYNVLLTRDSNDVNISNSDRAMVANTAGADVFVVIDGNDTDGTSVICQSDENPYTYGNYSDGRLLSDTILGSVVQNTGSTNYGVIESDEKTAINWCTSPTAIVEVSSLDESDEYQQKLAEGIASGINSYFAQK